MGLARVLERCVKEALEVGKKRYRFYSANGEPVLRNLTVIRAAISNSGAMRSSPSHASGDRVSS